MADGIKRMIFCIQQTEDIDMLDIGEVKRCALNRKMYDLIVFINSNLSEYVEYIKGQNNNRA